MKLKTIFGVMVALILMAGCKKKESNPQEIVAPSVAASADNSIQENVAGETDAFLTTQLRAFVQKKGRLPESFTEFHRTSLDSLPRPPAGKKWVIDKSSQSVKVVPAQ